METGAEWKDRLLEALTLAQVPVVKALRELKGASKHERARRPARDAGRKRKRTRKVAKASRRRNQRGNRRR